MVSEKLLKAFQKVIKEEYGKDITLEEAAEIMNGMVNYFDTLARMLHQSREVDT